MDMAVWCRWKYDMTRITGGTNTGDIGEKIILKVDCILEKGCNCSSILNLKYITAGGIKMC